MDLRFLIFLEHFLDRIHDIGFVYEVIRCDYGRRIDGKGVVLVVTQVCVILIAMCVNQFGRRSIMYMTILAMLIATSAVRFE